MISTTRILKHKGAGAGGDGHNSLNVLKTNEQYTLKGSILCYMGYISIKPLFFKSKYIPQHIIIYIEKRPQRLAFSKTMALYLHKMERQR